MRKCRRGADVSKSLSIYLDALRWLAALGVFGFHCVTILHPGSSWRVSLLGDECVVVFFVLSGFVIRFVSREKECDWREFASARMARLYSVVLLALVVTVTADHFGLAAEPRIYHKLFSLSSTPSPQWFIPYFTFTGELWSRHAFLGSNMPYWSLGYEVPYYVVFGFATYTCGSLRAVLIALWAVAVGPNILAYLPLWLMGVLTYDLLTGTHLPGGRGMGLLLLTASLALLVLDGYVFASTQVYPIARSGPPMRVLQSWAYFTVVGVAVTLHIIGFALFTGDRQIWSARIAGAIRWLAGASFTLYLTHEPLIFAAWALLPTSRSSLAIALTVAAVVFLFSLVLAELGERRKLLYRRAFRQLLEKCVPERRFQNS